MCVPVWVQVYTTHAFLCGCWLGIYFCACAFCHMLVSSAVFDALPHCIEYRHFDQSNTSVFDTDALFAPRRHTVTTNVLEATKPNHSFFKFLEQHSVCSFMSVCFFFHQSSSVFFFSVCHPSFLSIFLQGLIAHYVPGQCCPECGQYASIKR